MRYSDRYRGLVEAFSDPLTSADSMSVAEISVGESRVGVKIPESLRAYYLLMGRHPINGAHNRLLAPEKWFVNEGRLVFMEENQAVLYWGYMLDEASNDPIVFQGINQADKSIDWHCEDARCFDFLSVMICWQAVCGGLEFTGQTPITPEVLRKIRAGWSLVGSLGGGMVAFVKGGAVACVIGQGEDDLEAFAGARTEEDYERLDEALDAIGVVLSQN